MIDVRFVRRLGDLDMLVVSGVAYLVPAIKPTYSAELQAALRRRRTATLTGSCPCGGSTSATAPGRWELEHEADCHAGDDWIGPRLAAARERPASRPKHHRRRGIA